jgi:hypothetical protein
VIPLSIYQATTVLRYVFDRHINCSIPINKTTVADQQILPCHQWTLSKQISFFGPSSVTYSPFVNWPLHPLQVLHYLYSRHLKNYKIEIATSWRLLEPFFTLQQACLQFLPSQCLSTIPTTKDYQTILPFLTSQTTRLQSRYKITNMYRSLWHRFYACVAGASSFRIWQSDHGRSYMKQPFHPSRVATWQPGSTYTENRVF